MLYNQSIKNEFLKNIPSRSRASIRWVFSLFQRTEDEFGKDLCELDRKTIEATIALAGNMSTASIQTATNFIRRYVRWCNDNTRLSVNLDILNLRSNKIYGQETCKNNLIGGPSHLQKYLNEIFLPIEFGGADIIFRCFYWMIYGGLIYSETVNVKKSSVDLIKMQICHNNKTIPIYREAVEAFYFAKTSNTVSTAGVSRSGNSFIKRYQRADSEFLLSTTNKQYTSKTMQSASSRARIRDSDSRPGFKDISLKTIWLCGMFYRINENEKLGLPPNFSTILAVYSKEGYLGRGVSGTNRSNVISMERNLVNMYKSWKTTFS